MCERTDVKFKQSAVVTGKAMSRIYGILAAKKADPNADTAALEAEIDDLVFDLYGLTAEEREIVKGGGK